MIYKILYDKMMYNREEKFFFKVLYHLSLYLYLINTIKWNQKETQWWK